MAAEERRPGEADEARGDELEAERAEASAEGERADIEREEELDAGREGGEDSVLPADSDEERTGVMRPPGGA